jgi:ribokinase
MCQRRAVFAGENDMTIWNLGSINADMVYRVPHLPTAGETLAVTGFDRFLGGKGANMSVAAARAGADVAHIGAVGSDGLWARDRLSEYGIDTTFIEQSDAPTGHAIIAVADDGENQILLLPGANRAIEQSQVGAALSRAKPDDWFVTQNETSLQSKAVVMARELGLKTAYAAAPFDAQAVAAVLDHLDLLILNEVEAAQLTDATGLSAESLPVADVIITLGAKGARHVSQSGNIQEFSARNVDAVDTTGAGDTFTGYVLAGLDRKMSIAQAMNTAMVAAALMVTRHGTSDVIPNLAEVQAAM